MWQCDSSIRSFFVLRAPALVASHSALSVVWLLKNWQQLAKNFALTMTQAFLNLCCIVASLRCHCWQPVRTILEYLSLIWHARNNCPQDDLHCRSGWSRRR